jgi:endonuclease YncB( thermonuclease family)
VTRKNIVDFNSWKATTRTRRYAAWGRRHWGFAALLMLLLGGAVLGRGSWEGTPGGRLQGGAVQVRDGDSLRLGSTEIRLLGIDAPELFQTCRDERGKEWECGRDARANLAALLSRGEVRCDGNSKDKYDRTLAICSAGSISDVGDAIVRTGYALNFMTGSYEAAEGEARRNKRGIWRGSFERPEQWRRVRRVQD